MTPSTEILRYETPSGKLSLSVTLHGNWGENARFSYTGKLAAGCGPWEQVVSTVRQLRRFHPRSMRKVLSNVPAYKLL